MHTDGNPGNTFNIGSFYTQPNIHGENVQGCAYSLVGIKSGELFFPISKGDVLAHDVGSRIWVRKYILCDLF